MSHRKAERRTGRRSALVALALALFGCVLVQSALAATPTPESSTLCGGTLKRAKPTADDPNLLSYKFNCNGGISAYTLIVLRKSNDFNTIDDFDTNRVGGRRHGQPSLNSELQLLGRDPGRRHQLQRRRGRFNGLAGLGRGHVRHDRALLREHPARIARPAPSPTPRRWWSSSSATRTGAEDGPFRLRLAGKCPAVHAKPKTKTSKKVASKHAPKRAASK